jgi:uncharacterized OB-fold protein
MHSEATADQTGLATAPNEHPSFAAAIELPYKLTTGRAMGTFLAELAQRRIVGSRCPQCAITVVPAHDFCGRCGSPMTDFLELPAGGTLSGFTETHAGLLGLVRLDGTDTDFVHRLLDVTFGELRVGQRVSARWAAEPTGTVLDLEGFEPARENGEGGGAPRALQSTAEPIPEVPYRLHLDYQHAYGPYYGRLFDELATSRRIQGTRCPSCRAVLVPPREYCEVCFVRTGEWVDVADTGVLKAFSVIHLQFVGQVREPPYIYAEIVLDGSHTRLIHTIGGIPPEDAPTRLRSGMPVRAVWREDAPPTATLEDILHFEALE